MMQNGGPDPIEQSQEKDDYCAALVREGDRDRYLATLFAPAVHRNALLALYAFNVEITRIPELAREPMPGEIRLQWWREIILGERAAEASGHPVAAAIRKTATDYALSSERLLTIIDAHSFDLYDEPMADMAELESYVARTQGEIFRLAGEILGAGGPSLMPLTRHAGIAYGLMRILNGLARRVPRWQFFMPRDLLARHAINTEDVLSAQSESRVNAALADVREYIRYHLAAASAQFELLSSATLPALLPLALVGPQLRLMEKRWDDPLNATELSPIRRQWLLWRAARDRRRLFAI